MSWGGEGNTYKDKFFRSVLKKGFLKTKSEVLLKKKKILHYFLIAYFSYFSFEGIVNTGKMYQQWHLKIDHVPIDQIVDIP